MDETEVDSDSDGSSSSGDDDSDASSDDDSAKTPKSKKKRVPSSEMTDCGVQLTEDEVVETIVCDEKSRTIEFTVPAGINSPHVLVLEIAQEVAVKTIIRETPGIKQTFVVGKTDDEDPTGSQPLSIQTDGINFGAAWANSDLIEVNSMKSNSVWDIMQTFGVEAGRSTLVSEVQAVFGVYGIGVDTRHLSLIGDFMTQQGEYRACNRSGIEKSTSPFLKMSYETATAFLTDATIRGETDDLSSPSSRIVVGRTVDLGTGSFSLKHDIVRAAQYQEANKATGKHIRL
jgi:DNA-directed RNA polymerase I subunit RPA1